MGQLAVMGRMGDLKIIWDRARPEEVAAARAEFDAMRAKGYLAFSVKDKGEKGQQIAAFDPEAEKIILAPPMRGGR